MTTIQAPTGACMVELDLPIQAVFGFDEANPIEVTMTLKLLPGFFCLCGECTDEVGHEEVTFRFSRDLLDEAVGGPAEKVNGIGDVKVSRIGNSHLRFEVTSNAGPLGIITAYEPVRDFMIRSYVLVPFQQESADVDSAIQQILEALS